MEATRSTQDCNLPALHCYLTRVNELNRANKHSYDIAVLTNAGIVQWGQLLLVSDRDRGIVVKQLQQNKHISAIRSPMKHPIDESQCKQRRSSLFIYVIHLFRVILDIVENVLRISVSNSTEDILPLTLFSVTKFITLLRLYSVAILLTFNPKPALEEFPPSSLEV